MAKQIERFFRLPEDSCFIFGPRGTGKSTWLREHLGNAQSHFVNLLDGATYREYLAKPERIKLLVAGAPEKKYFILDEIQKVPALLESIHELIESPGAPQFILTGSSARKLRSKGVNLLAGRAVLRHFHPFMAAELKSQFNLDEALRNGLIPLVYSARNRGEKIKAYISLYLKSEVQAEGLVRDIGNFSRFLEVITFSYAGILNLNNIARDCQISRKQVENFILILEDFLIAYKLPVFTKRGQRKTVMHPKFYLFDVGVFYHLRPKGPLDRGEELGGLALEGLVMQHLKAWADHSSEDIHLYYWRTQAGSEVDFIIYSETHFIAIEVKHAERIHGRDLKPLRTFMADYPEATAVVLYRGEEKFKIDGVLCLNVEAFLLNLIPDHWPSL